MEVKPSCEVVVAWLRVVGLVCLFSQYTFCGWGTLFSLFSAFYLVSVGAHWMWNVIKSLKVG